jgi:hypothetical protein
VTNGNMNGDCGLRHSPRRAAGLVAVVAAVAALAVLTAACSGGTGSGGSASQPRPSHPPGWQQYHAYTRCMRSHGAPFWPEPTEVPAGVWDNPNTYKITAQILAAEHGSGWRAALSACQRLAPSQLPYTAAQVSALRSQLRRLAACVRTHGITHFPGPVAGPYGAGFPSPGPGVSPASAQFQAAQQACWHDAPGLNER